jgi:hypothetical protein
MKSTRSSKKCLTLSKCFLALRGRDGQNYPAQFAFASSTYAAMRFNQAQIPVLLRELQSEADECGNEEIRTHIEKVMRLVERAVHKSHTYIKFIGD